MALAVKETNWRRKEVALRLSSLILTIVAPLVVHIHTPGAALDIYVYICGKSKLLTMFSGTVPATGKCNTNVSQYCGC